MNPHTKALEAAYQLHFYLCFKTHYLQPLLAPSSTQSLLSAVLQEVCDREQYHLLEFEITDDHLRLLLSLQPTQTVANTAKMVKGNLDHEFSVAYAGERIRKLFARGYFARSSGKVDLVAARQYVDKQVPHHGYKGEWTKPLKYRNPAFRSPAFPLAHGYCLLNYHVVIATQDRTPIFDEVIAPGLFNCCVAIGEKHSFAIERMGLLPDHLHLIVEAKSDVAIEDCVRGVMENTRQWMEQQFSGVLKETGAWDVWRPSYYTGTIGEYTTAQVRKFLALG